MSTFTTLALIGGAIIVGGVIMAKISDFNFFSMFDTGWFPGGILAGGLFGESDEAARERVQTFVNEQAANSPIGTTLVKLTSGDVVRIEPNQFLDIMHEVAQWTQEPVTLSEAVEIYTAPKYYTDPSWTATLQAPSDSGDLSPYAGADTGDPSVIPNPDASLNIALPEISAEDFNTSMNLETGYVETSYTILPTTLTKTQQQLGTAYFTSIYTR